MNVNGDVLSVFPLSEGSQFSGSSNMAKSLGKRESVSVSAIIHD
jgi:hypothetical protein